MEATCWFSIFTFAKPAATTDDTAFSGGGAHRVSESALAASGRLAVPVETPFGDIGYILRMTLTSAMTFLRLTLRKFSFCRRSLITGTVCYLTASAGELHIIVRSVSVTSRSSNELNR